MTTAKRGRAINGDLFVLEHDRSGGPELSLDVPFTSFIDIAFRGVSTQAFCAADRSGFSYATTTGEFTVGGLHGHIVETLDAVQTQVSHRYQAIVETPSGTLSTHTYDSVESLLSLVGSLRPRATTLGIELDPDDEIEYTTAPRVALTLDIGVVELTPLTAEVIGEVPTWQGSQVPGGDLYGGRFTDDSAYLTLVTPTCRVVVLPGPGVDIDAIAATVSGIRATWRP